MSAAPRAAQSPSNNRSRWILSRIAAPFSAAAKPRNVTDFRIQTTDPHRQYSPGDSVKGSVCFTVHKPLRVTHIVLSLHGFVKVYKNPIIPGEGLPAEAQIPSLGTGRRGTEYHGNGFVSLFEDEVVVCGEGRLGPGRYSFAFDVQFPSFAMPTSLDFERGTISYVLTSTLTRPTTISPTMSCDKKIYMIEPIDIASISVPSAHNILLKPVTKRSKAKGHSKTSPAPSQDPAPTANAPRPSTSGELGTDVPLDETPGSPAPSELSSTSAVSSSISFRVGPGGGRSTNGSDIHSFQGSANDKTITATVDILRGGCLPGDLIPIRVTVQHNRPVKSLRGVIVTLYRKGRIDPHPLLPLGPAVKGREPVYEDYYPRSRTGLSGLSLSSRSSNHSFRMDLAQSFAPMVINPNTLEADIKTAVRVPDDVFPSISCVPGNMITFSYHIEVILDLNGKLPSQDRFMPRMNMTGSTSSFNFGQTSNTPNSGIVDTSGIRREKAIAVCLFNVTVGTKDSKRKNVRRALDPWDEAQRSLVLDIAEASPRTAIQTPTGPNSNTPQANQPAPNPPRNSRTPQPPQIPIPPPTEEEEPVDEKTRLRRLEERLLPSEPEPYASSSSANNGAIPSAPQFQDLHPAYPPSPEPGQSAPAYHASPSAPSVETIVPSASSSAAPVPPAGAATDDKLELERQRLLAAASNPDDYHHDEEDDDWGEGAAGPDFSPSAPLFNEEETNGHGPETGTSSRLRNSHDTYGDATPTSEESGSHLPRYQR